MIYTCYEMVRDCRADKPEGWSYFIAHYVPAISRLLERYPEAGLKLETVLISLRKPESSLFASAEPAPERWFVAELRQRILAEAALRDPGAVLDLETAAAAFEPLTVVEKLA